MLGNPFGRILDTLLIPRASYPRLYTWFAAFFLSGTWTLVWCAVFLLSTWFFNLKTLAHDFVYIFWLSIAAEAVIRWAENTNFIGKASRPYDPNAAGDNRGYTWTRALLLFSLAVLIMAMSKFWLFSTGQETPDLVLVGQGDERSLIAVNEMFASWWSTALSSTVVVGIFAGTAMRAIIYKRPCRD